MTTSIPLRRIRDDDRFFIDMGDSPDNPCTACGACCARYRVSFYCGELSDGSGGVVPVELTSKVNAFIACMKGTEAGNGRCIALQGELGQPGLETSSGGMNQVYCPRSCQADGKTIAPPTPYRPCNCFVRLSSVRRNFQ
ncbi:YkgJ family cysteine cluster protein [Rhodocyclus purpureus]|uniref:YkgJ family cysteine cluster protein n=1 Tax=Rhodocyclus purpureus TaxID=1067 RepID=UPI0019149243|nr:YkgJ family cysteine cluster protein [Rhodocyclus purpureus]